MRGLTLADGRRLTLRWAEDLRQWGQDALEQMQLTIDEAQQLLQSEYAITCAMVDEEDRMHAAAMADDARRRERLDQQRQAEQLTHCSRCGRRLDSWQSILKGIGPECERKAGSA
jgi:hypothetical protein